MAIKKLTKEALNSFIDTVIGSNQVIGVQAKGEKYDFAVVIGPAIMMKITTGLTVAAGIKTFASLNSIMVDGTGMCGSCRVTVGNETKFTCVDGPEFDASLVDWDEMLNRLGSFKEVESDHKCRVGI